jgi:hypothetical protein
MMKTYAARLPRIYSLTDLTHFLQAIKTIKVLLIKLWLSWLFTNSALPLSPELLLKIWFCLKKEYYIAAQVSVSN